MKEEWKPIKEADYYEVSTFGRLKRTRPLHYKKCKKEILTTPVGPAGYPRKYFKDLKINLNIHRLVAEAFIPNPTNLPCVNHKDSDRTKNHVDNLEWCTRQYNQQHAVNAGRFPSQKGEKHHSTKLTNIHVSIIKEAIKQNHRNCNIARYFKVHPSVIGQIKGGRQWKSVL